MFDDWMRSVNPRHEPTDDGMETRLLRACWAAAVAEERAAWRGLVTRATADANRYGLEGLHMRCTPSETGQLLSWEAVKPPNVALTGLPKASPSSMQG